MRQLRRWMTVGALLLVAACSKDKDIDRPAELTPVPGTLKIERIWSASVPDKGAKVLRLGLTLATEGNRVYSAGYKGEVIAFDVANGHVLWRSRLKKTPFSGGPAVGGGLVAVGTTAGEVIALESATGKVRWQVRLNGEILAAPAISDRAVAVRTVDGKLRALSPKDGHELWTQEQQVPRLSLRGTSRPVIAGDLTLCGFDNGKVLAVNMNDGSVQWEATVAPPHGRTELERLVDIDSTPRVLGQDVFTVGFQGRVARLALDNGQVWWSHDASSYRGIALDDDAIYVAMADGEVIALRQRTGAELWRQKALLHRGLSAVALTDNSVVTADYQGYVHWLDKATGELAGRTRAGKARVSNPPVVSGSVVMVIDDAGKISAFRATPIGGASGKRKAPAAADTAPADNAPAGTSATPPAAAEPAAAAPAPVESPSAPSEPSAPGEPPAASPPVSPK
jgi:outer membrane protein assembly factor BamB